MIRASPLSATCPDCRGFIRSEDVGAPPARSEAGLTAHAVVEEAAECGCELEVHSCVRERSLLRRIWQRLRFSDFGLVIVIRTCERHGASRIVFDRRVFDLGSFFGAPPQAKARATAEVLA